MKKKQWIQPVFSVFLTLAIIAVLLLLLSGKVQEALGLGKKEIPERIEAVIVSPSPEPTPIPTPEATPEPDWTPATAAVEGLGAVYTRLSRGEEVEITAEDDTWYLVTLPDGTAALMEKRLVRAEGAPRAEKREGYAVQDAALFDNPYLEGEPLCLLQLNTALFVEDVLGDIVYVSCEGMEGCMRASQIMDAPYYYVPRSGGGGSQDGGDIELSASGEWKRFTQKLSIFGSQSKVTPCVGTVLADNSEAYIWVYDRSETVRVTEWGEDSCLVLTKNGIAAVPTCYLHEQTEDPFEEYSAYAVGERRFYSDFRQIGEVRILDWNTELTVIDEINGILLVSMNDSIGYMPLEDVGSEPVYFSHSGGGKSSGGDWTPPAL